MSLGLIFGWAQITNNVDGSQHFDSDNQSISGDIVVSAWRDFMAAGGQLKAMHAGNPIGRVVFAMPLTPDIAAAMGVSVPHFGVMVGVQIDEAATLAAFQSGQFGGFSVGGSASWQDDPVAKSLQKMRFDGLKTKQTAVAFQLVELSVVTDPAQLDARIVLAKAADSGMTAAEVFKSQSDQCDQLIDQLAKQSAAAEGVPLGTAYRAVLHTELGKRLYAVSCTARALAMAQPY